MSSKFFQRFDLVAFIAIILGAAMLASCSLFELDTAEPVVENNRQVTIFIGEGFNNLSYDILSNLRTVKPLPMASSTSVFVAICHFTASGGDYRTKTSPLILRLSSDWSGAVVTDTLKILENGAQLTDKAVLKEALQFVKETFPSKHYGAILSSHGTGWLPEQYYSAPTVRKGDPRTKSFGCEADYLKSKLISRETNITDLEQAFPMKMDYLVFDACLMGCVEVAWQLRGVTDHIGFSQTEVLSYGFDYSTFSDRFLSSTPSDALGWCRDYYDLYNRKGGSSRSATISYINCQALDSLASICYRLNRSYPVETMSASGIQTFMRKGQLTVEEPWFYDLEDIYVHAGANEDELKELRGALGLCVEYAAHTDHFLELPVATNCGLSMFLPSTGTATLKKFYQNLDWNATTELVK